MTAPKFKTGDVVKCINGGPYQYSRQLTNGKHYEVKRGHIDGGYDTVDFIDDQGVAASAFASRFILVPVTHAGVGFRDGDIVRCVNPGVYSLTKGRFYLVRNAYTSGTDKFVTVTDDTGATANAFASRFVYHSRSTPFNRAPTTSEVEKARAERKAAEVARKEKGRARASASAPVKKPLLFTSLTEEDVHAALSTYLRAKLPIGLRVVDMDKTTEGYRITLGVPA
ncbi:hypothetical protein [Rhizobium leguminosarum]|uniref:hypothetical protein n=1 Tax=Rhizobium leguminosarum TaxID=384 RepID=UPI001C93D5AD|nr:hypothetical protein [Rhizobium leguminosarum]MBY5581834.1 hypothetical protein [Rhizobium leguminosarum]